MPDRALPAGLGRDLRALIESRGAPLRSATRLSGAPDRGRATFRLELEDGRVVKGRRCRTAAHAIRLERLGAALDPRHFPPVLARYGAGLLTEWVAGGPLTPGDVTVSRLRACGAILARIHRTPLGYHERLAALPSVDAWRERLTEWLDALAAAGALGRSEQAAAAALATRATPPRPIMGLAHGDLCARNIVLDRQAELHVVDNENLCVHAPEYDLARTWYLWPMSGAEWTAFSEGYALDRPLARFAAHFGFWAVLVLVESALFRLRRRTADPAVPLHRLRSLLHPGGIA